MAVREGANGNLNWGKQIGEDRKKREEGFGKLKVEDHDAVERAVDRHEGHGDRGVDEGKLKAFYEHVSPKQDFL